MKKPLVEVMIFSKLGPAAPEMHLSASIIVNLHFIGSSSPRLFAKNCFTKLTPIHELGEFQWHTLYLTALRTSDAEKRVDLGRRMRRSIT
jgi:predicted component of type VI protein secretion system